MGRIRGWAILIGAIVLAAWPRAVMAGGGGGGPCAGFASGTTLIMRDSCFDGVAHFVDARATLVVRNDGGQPHSYTAVDGSFDTGVLISGQSASIPLKATGLVRVFCTIHGTAQGHGMSGILVIGNAVPGADAARAAGENQALQEAIGQRDSELLGELQAQSKTLAEIKTELAGVSQSVAAASTAKAQPSAAAVLGIVGILLGGGSLAAVIAGRSRAARS